MFTNFVQSTSHWPQSYPAWQNDAGIWLHGAIIKSSKPQSTLHYVMKLQVNVILYIYIYIHIHIYTYIYLQYIYIYIYISYFQMKLYHSIMNITVLGMYMLAIHFICHHNINSQLATCEMLWFITKIFHVLQSLISTVNKLNFIIQYQIICLLASQLSITHNESPMICMCGMHDTTSQLQLA